MGCTRIEPGWVGIRVNLSGSDRGVEDMPVLTGWVFYNPINQRVYEFPTFQQRVIWTAGEDEGSPNDESITISSKESAGINCDVGVAVTFSGESVPKIFQKYRRPAELIVDGIVRDRVRQHLTDASGDVNAVDIFGPQMAEVLAAAEKAVQKEFASEGIQIEHLSFLSRCRPLSPDMAKAIEEVFNQKQRAQAAVEKEREAAALANQAIETARGSAESQKLAADAEAYSIEKKATAQAEAECNSAEEVYICC